MPHTWPTLLCFFLVSFSAAIVWGSGSQIWGKFSCWRFWVKWANEGAGAHLISPTLRPSALQFSVWIGGWAVFGQSSGLFVLRRAQDWFFCYSTEYVICTLIPSFTSPGFFLHQFSSLSLVWKLILLIIFSSSLQSSWKAIHLSFLSMSYEVNRSTYNSYFTDGAKGKHLAHGI